MDKLRLLVLYGGLSEEHPVSLKSARELSQNLDSAKYDPIYVFIGRDGLWRLNSSPEEAPQNGVPVALSTDRKNKGLGDLAAGAHVT
jgi:D-alanine--(R)-lactate ligase